MKNCAFISRHKMTEDQVKLAEKAGYLLMQHEDYDPFVAHETLKSDARFYHSLFDHLDKMEVRIDAVCCVHPSIAVAALGLKYDLLVFNNKRRGHNHYKFETDSVMVFEWDFYKTDMFSFTCKA